jgi:hypothetical protein
VGKEPKTDAVLEDMILQRLVIGGVFVSVRRDPILGWRPTVVTAPKHTRNAQELADKIAAELRKKFTLRNANEQHHDALHTFGHCDFDRDVGGCSRQS